MNDLFIDEADVTNEVKIEDSDVEMQDIESEGDPIVKSVPVFLANGVGDRLAVIQYPTRKATPQNQAQDVVQVRIKPQSQVIETDLFTGLPESYVDADKATKWGDEGLQTFGGLLKPSRGRYAVGKLVDGELHLSLVSSTTQLRPQFNRFNEISNESKEVRMIKSDGPPATSAAARAVQMSAKTSGEQAVKFSEVLEFWKDANDETFNAKSVQQKGDQSVLVGECREPVSVASNYGNKLEFNL